jgi:hypothetical protein
MKQGSKEDLKKLLKHFNLSETGKPLKDKTQPKKGISNIDKIEEGKNKHRSFMQQIKNEEIREKYERGEYSPNLFSYKGIEPPSYDQLKSLLIKKNWDEEKES